MDEPQRSARAYDAIKRKLGQRHGYGCRSGKRRFASRSAAYMQMIRQNAAGTSEKPIRDIYQCGMCSGWHTSSREPE